MLDLPAPCPPSRKWCAMAASSVRRVRCTSRRRRSRSGSSCSRTGWASRWWCAARACVATEAGSWLCRHVEQVGMLESDLLARDAGAGPARCRAGPRRRLRVAVNADSLDTWFVAAIAAFSAQEPALLDLSLDDQEHTAEWLRTGAVLAAVTADRQAGPGLPQRAARPHALPRHRESCFRARSTLPTA